MGTGNFEGSDIFFAFSFWTIGNIQHFQPGHPLLLLSIYK